MATIMKSNGLHQALAYGAAALLWMGCATVARADTTRYFRQLAYNHVSPWVPLRGIHEIDAATAAKGAAHYAFRYDDSGRLIEIVNHNPEAWKRHPLASLGVPRLTISWTATTETRRFFDADGKPIKGIRGASREVFTRDASGFRTGMAFFNENGAPVENVWHIARYAWTKRGDWVIERRTDLVGHPMPVSTYFPFGVTGMKLGPDGIPTGHYNLDPDTLQPANGPDGVASYHDVFDPEGNHVEITYRDKDGHLALNTFKYATMRKTYDAHGNVLRQDVFDLADRLLRFDSYTYDDAGNLLARGGSDK